MLISCATHVLDLEHTFSVLLHEVHLVGVGAVDVLHFCANVIFLGIVMLVVGCRRDVAGWLSMRIRRQDLGERVSHFELAIEGFVEVRLNRV